MSEEAAYLVDMVLRRSRYRQSVDLHLPVAHPPLDGA